MKIVALFTKLYNVGFFNLYLYSFLVINWQSHL